MWTFKQFLTCILRSMIFCRTRSSKYFVSKKMSITSASKVGMMKKNKTIVITSLGQHFNFFNGIPNKPFSQGQFWFCDFIFLLDNKLMISFNSHAGELAFWRKKARKTILWETIWLNRYVFLDIILNLIFKSLIDYV